MIFFVVLLFISHKLFSPTIIQAQIKINEVCPAPDTGPEQIELYYLPLTADTTTNQATSSANLSQNNCSPDLQIDLNQWELWDKLSQPSLLIKFSQQILCPGDFFIIELNRKLNNGGDEINLFDQNSQLIDCFGYDNSQANLCWARSPDGKGSFMPLQNSINQANPSLTPTPSPSTLNPTLPPSAQSSTITPKKPDFPDNNQLKTANTTNQIIENISDLPPNREKSTQLFQELKQLDQKLSNLLKSQHLKLKIDESAQSIKPLYFQEQHPSKSKIIFVIIGGTLWLSAAFYLYKHVFDKN